MRYINGIAILDERGEFPDPQRGHPDLPVAIGLELSAELMLKAYARGIFAWSVDPVTWWSPDPRAIIEMDGLHVSQRLARTIRQNPFEITFDEAFQEVLAGCAAPRKDYSETWITAEFFQAFEELFDLGYAHSVECWHDGELAGGVFGVALGGFFSAESMFYRVTDASKVALYNLLKKLRQDGFMLFDIQVITAHTRRMGAVEISRSQYVRRLRQALKVCPSPWELGCQTME